MTTVMLPVLEQLVQPVLANQQQPFVVQTLKKHNKLYEKQS